MSRLFVLSVLGLLALAGCEKKEAPAPASAPSEAPAAAAVPAAAATPPPAEPTVDVASLPVEEQFEADAEKEVTAENLTAKLDEIEKEIAAP